MPQRDKYHYAVRIALVKAGWRITHDPLTFRLEDIRVHIDLSAETDNETIRAEREVGHIAIEVKVLEAPGIVDQLENAFGQYIIYRTILRLHRPSHRLYLAVSVQAYNSLFQGPTIPAVVAENNINLVVYDPVLEEIVTWSV